MARKVLQNGRSGGFAHSGRAKRWRPEPPFLILPRALLESPGYRALSVPARHVVDFLQLEHLSHGGAENGRLLAPYAQLEKFGISSRDIRGALDMAEAFGIIRCTQRGERLGGRTKASTYALTWYPTADGELPSEEFRRVTVQDVDAFFGERTRLKALRVGRTMKARDSALLHQDIERTLQKVGERSLHLTGEER